MAVLSLKELIPSKYIMTVDPSHRKIEIKQKDIYDDMTSNKLCFKYEHYQIILYFQLFFVFNITFVVIQIFTFWDNQYQNIFLYNVITEKP